MDVFLKPYFIAPPKKVNDEDTEDDMCLDEDGSDDGLASGPDSDSEEPSSSSNPHLLPSMDSNPDVARYLYRSLSFNFYTDASIAKYRSELHEVWELVKKWVVLYPFSSIYLIYY